MRLFSKIFGKPHRRIVVGSRTGKSKKFPLHLPKRTFFTVVVVNSGQNTPPQSLYWWSKPVYPQTRAAEESGSFLEQDSTTVPKSAYLRFCPLCGGVFCPLFTTTTVKRGRFGKRSENFFIFPVCSLQQSGGVVCQRFLKMGAKKAVNLFKIYCLSAAVMGGGIKLSAVFQMEFICNRFLSAFQFLFCNLP